MNESDLLTDETLKELGFEYQEECKEWELLDIGYFYLTASVDYDENGDEYLMVTLTQYGYEISECYTQWKTVGSVKRLMEALEGDE